MKGNRNTMCKKELNSISETIRRMTSKRALERWEYKITNSEITSQAIWSIVKLLINVDGPRSSKRIKSNCLEKQFTPHDLCEANQ
jgi:hypothetical protein